MLFTFFRIFKNYWKTLLGVHFFSSLQNPISTLKWRKYNQSQFKLSKIVTSHLKNAFQNKSNFWLITLKNLSNPLHFRGFPVKRMFSCNQSNLGMILSYQRNPFCRLMWLFTFRFVYAKLNNVPAVLHYTFSPRPFCVRLGK